MKPAQERPDDRGDAGREAGVSFEPAATLGRKEGGGGETAGRNEAAADALHEAESNQLIHGLTQARRNRAERENDQAEGEEHPAPIDVGQPPHDRHGDCGRHQIGRGRPGVAVEAAQVGDDARHGGGDDGLAEDRQKHRQHHAGRCQGKLPWGSRLGCEPIQSSLAPQSPAAAIADAPVVAERLPTRRNRNDLPGWRVGRPFIFRSVKT